MTDGKCTNFESEALVKLFAERGYDVTHEHVVVTAETHDIQEDEEIERSACLAMFLSESHYAYLLYLLTYLLYFTLLYFTLLNGTKS